VVDGLTSAALVKEPSLVPAGGNRVWDVWDEPPPILPETVTVVAIRLILPTEELACGQNSGQQANGGKRSSSRQLQLAAAS
jgi:hypothetical protein